MKKLYYLIIVTIILGLVLTGCSLLSNVGQVPTTGQKGMPLSTANLVALWHLDGNANDSTGNGNDGIIYGTSWVDGKLGKALSFDVSGDYVDCGSNVGSFNLSNPFTIEAWINPAFGNTDVIYGNAWAEPGYHVRVTSGNRVRFILITNGSNYKGIDSSVLTAGWHHIAAVWDGTSVKIYIDGVDDSQTPIVGGTVTTITTVVNTKIGLDTAAHYFNGIIDEIRIWNTALTIDQLGSVIVATDIKPQSCPNPLNVKSKGVLPVAILGTENFDVTKINPDTIELAGVSLLRWALEDVATPYEPFVGKEDCMEDCIIDGPDEFLDLTLKFYTQEVVEAIEAIGEVNDGDCLVLTLTGNLFEEFGGTPIVGEDVVLILKKGK